MTLASISPILKILNYAENNISCLYFKNINLNFLTDPRKKQKLNFTFYQELFISSYFIAFQDKFVFSKFVGKWKINSQLYTLLFI